MGGSCVPLPYQTLHSIKASSIGVAEKNQNSIKAITETPRFISPTSLQVVLALVLLIYSSYYISSCSFWVYLLVQNLWDTLTVPLELFLLNGIVELKGLDPNCTRELNLFNSYLVSKV